jgi:hypothetical protein
MVCYRYILKGHEAVQEPDLFKWAQWLETADRVIRQEEIERNGKRYIVSTVFLGVDHQWGSGPPLLFETGVFDRGEMIECKRCPTWDEAERMHRHMKNRYKGTLRVVGT